MNEVSEKKKIIHQGRNIRITRESKGLYQKELGDKINKNQSDISKIENQEIIEDELLEQIALALEVPTDFLRNFDLDTATKTYNNTTTINSPESSNELVNNQGEGKQENINIYNYPIEEFKDFAENTLKMQKELLEEKHILDKENALLKQELEFLKNKK